MISISELDQTPYPQKIELIGLKLISPFTASNKHHDVQCKVCNHIWSTTLISKISTYKKYQQSGCPNCHKLRKDARSDAANRQEIVSKGFIINSLSIVKQLTTEYINVTNTSCGHTFDVSPGNIINRNVACPICAKTQNIIHLQQSNRERYRSVTENRTEWESYEVECRLLTRQVYEAHGDVINPQSKKLGLAGTVGAHHLDHIISVKTGFEHSIPKELICSVDNLQIIPWEANMTHRTRLKSIPNIFADYFDVTDLYAFESLLEDISFTRDGDSPFPFCYKNDQFNMAIIYCYFDSYGECSQQRRRLTYKAKMYYKQQGIRCIIVFEDEWKFKRQLVQSKLHHILGHNKNTTTIHARKCIIQQIDSKIKNAFLNINHIQGADDAVVSYGAYFNNVLYAVMTFARPRVFYKTTNYKDTNTWELSRFATDNSVLVTGIANRLLKTFQSEHNWGQIISYADMRWSEGHMYNQLGFDFIHINPPGYHYIVDGIRKHRWKFRKDVLKSWDNYNSNKTEFQMTSEKGISRVWDCGTMLFTLKNQQ